MSASEVQMSTEDSVCDNGLQNEYLVVGYDFVSEHFEANYHENKLFVLFYT